MRVRGRIAAWGSTVAVVCLAFAAGATAASSAPTTPTGSGSGGAVVDQQAAGGSASGLPPGVLPRSVILAQDASTRPGVTTEAKLVSLAQLAAVSQDELTQCQYRGCPPGAYVWLVLQEGPPGSFPHSEPPGAHQAPGADAWMLEPVDAATGVPRGDLEIGSVGQLGSSAWGQLKDLAPPG